MGDRVVCTEADPWTKDKGDRSVHPDAKSLGDDYGSLAEGGSFERFECPWCGLRFKVALPD